LTYVWSDLLTEAVCTFMLKLEQSVCKFVQYTVDGSCR